MNDQVAAYSGLVAHLAEKYAATRGAKVASAEYDDLYQEGMIDVWQALERGVTPSTVTIENQMRKWIRTMRRQSHPAGSRPLSFDEARGGDGE